MMQTPDETMKYSSPDFSIPIQPTMMNGNANMWCESTIKDIPSSVRGSNSLENIRMTHTKMPDTDCPASTVWRYFWGKSPQNAVCV